MRYPKLFLALFILAVLIGNAAAQADSGPVMQGSVSYSMPQSAIDAEIDGAVVVALHVDENGKPSKAVMVSGPAWPCGATPVKAIEDLAKSLSELVLKQQFSPAIKGGKATAADVGLTINLKNPKLTPGPAEIDPATGKPRARFVTGGVLNGKAVSLARPTYPSEAKANRDGGAVSVQVMIGEEGQILRAGAISGAATLQFAARDAACRSKFSPTTLADYPVKVSGVITYNFVP